MPFFSSASTVYCLTLSTLSTYSNEVIEGKYDVYVTIEADTDVSDLAIKAGGTAVKVGAEIPVRGKGYASTGYVIGIDD